MVTRASRMFNLNRFITSEQQVSLLLNFYKIAPDSARQRRRRCRRHHLPPAAAAAVPPLLEMCDRAGQIIMALILVKSAFFDLIEWSILNLFDWDRDGLLLAMPAACFIPGRYVMHEVVRNELAACVSAFVLIFNNMQRLVRRRHALTTLYFMLQPDERVEHFHLQHHTGQKLAGGDEPLTQAMCFKVEASTSSSNSTFEIDQYQAASRRVSLRLRPNRTRQARRKLRRNLAGATRAILLGFAGAQIAAFCFVIPFIMTDFYHLNSYKNCDPILSSSYESDARHRWFWVTHLTPYRIVMSLVDSVENYGLLTFPYLYYSYASTMIYLLSEDLEIYLKFLQEQLRLVCQKKRRWIWANNLGELASFEANRLSWSQFYWPIRWHEMSPRFRWHQPANWGALAANRDLDEVRAQVRDFFAEFDRVGLVINDIVSFGFVAWILSLVVVYGKAIRHNALHPTYLQDLIGISLPQLMAIVVPVVFVPSSLLCLMLFRLHAGSLVAYRSLSSFLALSQASSPVERAKFQREITENYTGLHRNCFKVFQTYPFKPLSFLSFIGWTVSAFAVMFSLAGRNEHNGV